MQDIFKDSNMPQNIDFFDNNNDNNNNNNDNNNFFFLNFSCNI